MENDGRSVIRYKQDTDDKGREILKPIFLKDTPIEEIERLNTIFQGGNK